MAKRTKKKTAGNKPKSPSIKTAANQDIVGLLSVLVERLTSFEAKINQVLSTINSIKEQPAVANKQQPAMPSVPEHKRINRPMFKAVCADCGMGCEVPFKPKGDRLIYCKVCFSKRRNSKPMFKPREISLPKQERPINAAALKKPKESKPKKSVKKPAKRKKPKAKKKKAKR